MWSNDCKTVKTVTEESQLFYDAAADPRKKEKEEQQQQQQKLWWSTDQSGNEIPISILPGSVCEINRFPRSRSLDIRIIVCKWITRHMKINRRRLADRSHPETMRLTDQSRLSFHGLRLDCLLF